MVTQTDWSKPPTSFTNLWPVVVVTNFCYLDFPTWFPIAQRNLSLSLYIGPLPQRQIDETRNGFSLTQHFFSSVSRQYGTSCFIYLIFHLHTFSFFHVDWKRLCEWQTKYVVGFFFFWTSCGYDDVFLSGLWALILIRFNILNRIILTCNIFIQTYQLHL